MRGRHGKRPAQGDREFRGRAHHALHRRVHGGRRDPDRRAGQAPGGHQSQEHAVRGEAADRPPLRRRRSAEGAEDSPVQDRRGAEQGRLGRGARQEDGAARDFRAGADEDEEDRRGLSRRAGHRGGDHGARVLQRLAAPGDQGRRPHRGPRRQAHHQRADRGRARVRPRQAGEEGPQDRGLRPGRRHVRHLDHRDRRRRGRAPVRGALDQRRHLPRRRGLRPAPDRVPVRRVQEGQRHRPQEGHARAAAAEGRGRESEDRALLDRSRPRSTCPTSRPTSRDRSTWRSR